jgi:hypothetical protein
MFAAMLAWCVYVLSVGMLALAVVVGILAAFYIALAHRLIVD